MKKLNLVAQWMLVSAAVMAAEPAPNPTNAPPADPPSLLGPALPATNAPPARAEAAPAATNPAPVAAAAVPAPALPATNDPPARAEAAPAATNAVPVAAAEAERNIRFQFDGIPYMDVVERFAQMVNRPLVTDVKVEGSLTFADPQPYNYQEALDTLNLVLSMKDVMLVESDRYLRLVPFKKLPQMALKILRGQEPSGDVRPGEVVTVVMKLQVADPSEVSQSITPMLSNAGSMAPLPRNRGLIITDRLDNIKRIGHLLAQIDTAAPADRQMKTINLVHSSGAIVTDLINRTFGVATAPTRTRYNEQQKKFDALPPDPNDYVTAVWDEASKTLVLYGPTERIALAEELVKRFEDKQGARASDVKIFYPQTMEAEDLARMIRQAVPGVAGMGESVRESSTRARLIIDTTYNRLIVTAPVAGQLDSIEELVRRIDTGASGKPTTSEDIFITRVFQLRSSDPASVAKVISDTLVRRGVGGRPSQGLRVTTDANTRRVITIGSPGDVQRAEEIVKQLDENVVQAEPIVMRSIDVQGRPVNELSGLAERLYGDQVKSLPMAPVVKATLFPESKASRIIVSGPEAEIARVEAIVRQLMEKAPAAAMVQLRSFDVKGRAAADLSTLVERLYSDQVNSLPTPPVAKASLLVEAKANRILVSGPETEIARVEAIIRQVDESTAASASVQLSSIDVKGRPVAELVLLAEKLYSEQVTNLTTPPPVKATLVAEAKSNRVLVSGPETEIARVEAIIRQLEARAPVAAPSQLRPIDVKGRSVAELVPLAEKLYTEQINSLPAPPPVKATLIVEAKSNRILVSGPETEAVRMEAIIRQLEEKAPAAPPVILRSFELKGRSVVELVPLAEKLYTEQINSLPSPPAAKATLIVEAKSNRILVSGPETEIARVEAIIRQLEEKAPAASPVQLRLIEVKGRSVVELVPLAEKLYTEQINSLLAPPTAKATLVVEAKSNRILVSGPETEIARVEAIIRQLEEKAPEASPVQLRLIEVKGRSVAELVPLAEKLYTEQINSLSTPPRAKATLVPEAKANRILVSGPEAEIARIEAIIGQLEEKSPASSPVQLRSLEIRGRPVAELVTLAERLYTEQVNALPSAPSTKATLVAEAKANRVLVSGPEAEIARMEAIIRQLDPAEAKPAREETRVIRLQHAMAVDLSALVEQNFASQRQNLRILVDARSNSLVVSGKPETADAAAQLIQALDSEPQLASKEMRFIELKSTDPATAISLVREVYTELLRNHFGANRVSQLKLIPDAGSNRIILCGPRDEMDLIAKLIEQVDKPSDQPGSLRVFKLKSANARQIAPVIVNSILNRDPRRAGGRGMVVTPDDISNSLVVSGTPTDFQQITSLIEQLDGKGQSARVTEIFDLGEADDVQRLLPLIQQTYREEWRSKAPDDPADAQILADPAGGRILVTAPSNHIAAIQTIIKRVASGGESTSKPETRVYDLTTATANDLAATVQSLYRVQRKQKPGVASQMLILPDTATNRLLVSGPAEELEAVEQIVKKLDTVSPRTSITRIFKLQRMEPSLMVSILTQAMGGGYPGQGMGPGGRRARGQPRITVAADASTRVLIMSGENADLQSAEKIIEQLDKLGERSPRQMEIFDVGQPEDVQRLLPMVQQLYREEWKEKPADDPADGLIMGDSESGRLVVTAPSNHIAAIQGIVKRLTSSAAKAGSVETRVYDLTNASAGELSTTVQSLYRAQRKQRPALASQMLILPDLMTNRLLVSGPVEELNTVEEIIKKLDTVSPRTSITKIYKLQRMDPSQMVSILSQAWGGGGRRGRNLPRITVAADTSTRVLILSGENADLQAAEKMIEQLDKLGERSPRQMEIFDVGQPEDVQRLLPMVQQLYREEWKEKPADDPADGLIMGDSESGRLVVTAPSNHIAAIQGIVKRLTSSAAKAGSVETRVYDLTNASAGELSTTVQSLYRAQRKQRPALASQMLILPDLMTNRLLVSGPVEELNTVEEIIKKLDTVSPRTSITKIYKMQRMDATQMSSILSQAWGGGGRRGRNLPRITVAADSTARILILSGESADLQAAEKMIEQLDKLNERSPRQMQIFDVGQMEDVQRVLPLVQQLYREEWKDKPADDPPDALILGDSEAGRLVVTAPTNHLASIQAIVKQLTTGVTKSSAIDTRVYDLTTASAGELSATVQALYRAQRKQRPALAAQMLILPDTTTNRLLVSGPAEEMDAVEEIIKKLDTVSPRTSTTRLFKLQRMDPSQMASILSQALGGGSRRGRALPRITVAADTASRVLVMSGDSTDLQAAENIIEQLDKLGERSPRKMEIFDVGQPEDVQAMQPLVQQLYREAWKDKPADDPADALILADPQSGRIVVTAPTNHLEAIQGIIKSLTANQAKKNTQTRVYDLTTASASELAANVQSLYKAQRKERPAVASQMLILADRTTNRLLVSGPADELETVEEIIKKLDTVSARTATTKVFQLKTQDPNQMATIISTVLGGANRGGRALPRISAGADPQTKILIISGDSNDLQAATEIIEKLDSLLDREPREIRVFSVKLGLASEVATRVKDLYLDQIKGMTNSGPADAIITGDFISNRLIVAASQTHMKVLQEIVSKLEQSGDGAERQVRLFPLKHNSAASVATMVQQLFAHYQGRVPSRYLAVTAAPDDKTLVVEAAVSALDRVAEVIRSLDVESARSGMEVKTFRLTKGNATELAATMGRLFTERQDRRRVMSPDYIPPRFEADATSNSLIVAALSDQFKQVEQLITELQAASEITVEIRTFKLQYSDAQQTAAVLESMLIESGRGLGRFGGGAPPDSSQPGFFRRSAGAQDFRVMAAPAINSLVIQATPKKLLLAAELIRNLDRSEADGAASIRMVQLSKADPEAVAMAINQTLTSKSGGGGGGRGQPPRVTLTPIPATKSLLINGPPEEVRKVITLIKEVDQDSVSDDPEVRIFKLEYGTAKEMSRTITQILQGMARSHARTGRGGGREGNFTVSTDDRSNSLVVSASPDYFKLVEQLLKTLDKKPDKSDREVQFYWLKNASAFDVAYKLETMFEDRDKENKVVVESDSLANSLTVIARRQDIPEIEALIAQFDDSAKDSSIQVRLLPVATVPVEQMATMLKNIYPQMSDNDLQVVEKLPPAQRESGSGSSTNAPPAAGKTVPDGQPVPEKKEVSRASVETGTNRPPVVIAVDKKANALVLSGPANDLNRIESIVSQLTRNFNSNETEFRFVALKEADPVAVARTLNELFRSEGVRPPGQGGGRSEGGRGEGGGGGGRRARGQGQGAGQAQNQSQPQPQPAQPQPGQPMPPMPPKISVVAEPRTRSLIIRAKPSDFALLESLIQQLDVPGLSSQLAFRLLPLTYVHPDKIMPMVRQMLDQMDEVRPGEPVAVARDPRTRAIFMIGRETVLNQLENLVDELDSPAPFAEIELKTFNLKNSSAPQVALILREMLRPGPAAEMTTEARELQDQVSRLKVGDDQGKPLVLNLQEPIKIMSDPGQGGQGGANRLIIGSTPGNLKALGAVIRLMDTVPVIDGLSVRILGLKYVDANVAVQTLNNIFQQGLQLGRSRGQGQGGGGGRQAVTSAVNFAIDQRSNAIIVSGQKESIALAEKIIKDLDRELDSYITEVKLFPLKNASPSRLLSMLRAVFIESGGGMSEGARGLGAQVTRLRTVLGDKLPKTTEKSSGRPAVAIQADDLSSILIIAARSDLMPLIEDLVNTLDKLTVSGADSIRIYTLDHSDATTVQRVINDLLRGTGAQKLRPEERPSLTIDDRTNALIVSGTDKAFEFVDNLVKLLDRELPVGLRDIQMVPLENADALTVAPTLQRLMDERIKQKGSLGRQTAETLRVIIIADPRTNCLLVGGNKENYELVKSLAEQLDQAAPGLGGQVRLVPLKNGNAQSVSATLTTLFVRRYQASRAAETQRNRPVIMADPRSNSLLVAASVEDNKTIDLLLEKLDRKLENPAVTVNVVPLQHNDAARLANVVESVLAARLQSMTPPGQPPLPEDRVNVEADLLSNSLIVSANKDNLQVVKELIAKLDAEPVAIGGVIQMFTLKYADVQRLSTMLRSLIEQGVYRPGAMAGGAGGRRTSRDALAITADLASNTLIVSASPENMMIVKELIRQIDTADYKDGGDIKLYHLKHAKASHLAQVLDQFFRAKRTGEANLGTRERSLPMTVTADDRTNTLLVTGGKENFAAIERMIEQLDSQDVASKTNFRVFTLKHSTASKLQSTLQRLFSNRPTRIKGEAPDPITIVADSWDNALIIGATVDDLGMAESLIAQLDIEQPDANVQVQVFPMSKADARRVSQTIQSLFRGSGAAGSGVSQVAINVDDRLNAIVVSAGEADLKRIAELVKKLDTDQVARIAEIRVFPLAYARASALATILSAVLNGKPQSLTEDNPNRQSLLQFITRSQEGQDLIASALKEGILITPDPRTNALIVSAPVDYMDLLEQVIKHLDQSAPQIAKIRVFNLRNADARQMALVLTTLFRLQRTGPVQANERTVQYTLVKGSEGAAAGTGEDSEGPSALVGSAEENALTVTVDFRTNSLLVGGTEHYVALSSEIIETLDSTPAQERKSEVYRLRNSRALDVQNALRTFLAQDIQKVISVLGPQGMGSAESVLEREASIVAETNSNTLLISASPRYFDEVKTLIEQLDQPTRQVLIQALIAEVTLDNTDELGVEWTYTSKGQDQFSGTSSQGLSDMMKSAGGGGYSAAVTGGNYNFLIRALQNEGRLEVLSRPQILTADNQEASINIGQRIPTIDTSRASNISDTTVTAVRYENVGVLLTVTPRISPDNFVKMDISTTNSQVSSSTVQLGKDMNLPIINERRATTTVTVQSGQSILIGGLISTTNDKRTRKLPVLGDIPGLGYLFRSKKTITERRELLILLTPQIMLKGADMLGKTFDAKTVTDEQLRNSTIKDEIKRDKLQRMILDPILPLPITNAPPAPPIKSAKRNK